jgi:hypothetical protein
MTKNELQTHVCGTFIIGDTQQWSDRKGPHEDFNPGLSIKCLSRPCILINISKEKMGLEICFTALFRARQF